jgi:hypothetical protein
LPGFAYGFNCVQRCLSIATVVASGYGPVASLRIEKRLGSPPRVQPLRTSHHKADADPYIRRVVVFWFRFRYVPDFKHFIIYVFLL